MKSQESCMKTGGFPPIMKVEKTDKFAPKISRETKNSIVDTTTIMNALFNK